MRIVAIANQKGGCGKTTTSIHLSACLALLQKKVLLLDLDPQGHSTCGLGLHASENPLSLYDLLSPHLRVRPKVEETLREMAPYFSIIPSYGILGALEEEWAPLEARETRLRAFLQSEEIKALELDYVLMDCPPQLGLLSWNALQAADELIIPIEPSFFSLHGLAKISETVTQVNQKRATPLVLHALLTLFNSETRFSQEVYEEVKKHFNERLFKTIIHENVLLKEAASAGMSIVDYDRTSGAFRDYFNLAVECLERQWDRMLPDESLGWNNVMQQYYGPRRVPGGVLFQTVYMTARWVEIAGDFNQWIPEPMVRREDGLWQKVVAITSGTFRYKFIVDGEWQLDPFQPRQQKNAFGTLDSYLEVP